MVDIYKNSGMVIISFSIPLSNIIYSSSLFVTSITSASFVFCGSSFFTSTFSTFGCSFPHLEQNKSSASNFAPQFEQVFTFLILNSFSLSLDI